jgi:hypothetical protein
MFSDPNIVEWISGLKLIVVTLGMMVGVGFLFALTAIRVLGEEEIRPQGKRKTLDTATMSEKKRTAA